MFRTFAVAALIVGLFALVRVCVSEAAKLPNANVTMFYGYNGAEDRVVDTTTVYLGHGQWNTEGSKSKNGGLTVSKAGVVSIRLAKGEKVIEAYADYGTVTTPTFRNFPIGANEEVLPYALLRAKNGETYRIKLSSVFVVLYEPRRPQGPPKGDK
jgi:hypothetical protein